METSDSKRVQYIYSVVQLTQAFYEELLMIPFDDKAGRVNKTKTAIWEYIPTTTLRLYWLNKRTWIHKLVEIKWQAYLHENLIYPNSSFQNYLLKENWSAQFSIDTVDAEIKIWFEIRNKILQ